jgi:hypothetical protein
VASTPLGVRMSGQGNGNQTLEGLTLPIPRLNAKARVLRGRREFRLAVLCAGYRAEMDLGLLLL